VVNDFLQDSYFRNYLSRDWCWATLDSVEPCLPPACGDLDLDALAAADNATRRQLLGKQTARFVAAFHRWVDGQSCGGLSYLRLHVLGTLASRGPTMMRDLADQLGISARNTTALVDALEEAGLVERQPHPTDRRATLVRVTEGGTCAARTSLGPIVAATDRLFDAFSSDEQVQLMVALTKLLDALHQSA